jgi:hypothetical protein
LALLNSIGGFGLALRLGMLIALLVAARGQVIDEYQVKAAFVYNFAKFVEWPAHSFTGPSAPIVICILGDDPFGSLLDIPVNGKLVEGRPLVVRRMSDVRHVKACQILFISSSERKRLASILAEVKLCGILTVGDMAGFAAEGGVITLQLEDGRVRFQVNMDAAEQQGLRISSKLLSLAQIVRDPKVPAK